MMTSSTGRDDGFTLVEVLVAAIVLAVGMAGVLIALGRVVEGAAIVAAEARATVVAQHALDELELAARARQPLPMAGQAAPIRWTAQVAPDLKRPLDTWTVTLDWPVRRQTRTVQVTRVWKRL